MSQEEEKRHELGGEKIGVTGEPGASIQSNKARGGEMRRVDEQERGRGEKIRVTVKPGECSRQKTPSYDSLEGGERRRNQREETHGGEEEMKRGLQLQRSSL